MKSVPPRGTDCVKTLEIPPACPVEMSCSLLLKGRDSSDDATASRGGVSRSLLSRENVRAKR